MKIDAEENLSLYKVLLFLTTLEKSQIEPKFKEMVFDHIWKMIEMYSTSLQDRLKAMEISTTVIPLTKKDGGKVS
jgi:hypothetical protein